MACITAVMMGTWSTTARADQFVPARWYTMLAPYHYSADTPFQAGQQRGIVVRARTGVVPAFMGGVVRFAGQVAGRGVVSIIVRRSNHEPLVSTYVGVRPSVRKGQRINRGVSVGSSSNRALHLGLRSLNDRMEYLPLAVASDHTGVGSTHPRFTPHRSAPADAVVQALARAISGDVRVRLSAYTVRNDVLFRVTSGIANWHTDALQQRVFYAQVAHVSHTLHRVVSTGNRAAAHRAQQVEHTVHRPLMRRSSRTQHTRGSALPTASARRAYRILAVPAAARRMTLPVDTPSGFARHLHTVSEYALPVVTPGVRHRLVRMSPTPNLHATIRGSSFSDNRALAHHDALGRHTRRKIWISGVVLLVLVLVRSASRAIRRMSDSQRSITVKPDDVLIWVDDHGSNEHVLALAKRRIQDVPHGSMTTIHREWVLHAQNLHRDAHTRQDA